MTESRYRLDSNIVVYLDQKRDRIPVSVLDRLESASEVFLSAVTAWEPAIKQSLGALSLAIPVSEMVRTANLIELPVTIQHCEAVRNLPLHHRNPFDRLLVAQALVEGLVLVTSDGKMGRYGLPILLV